jgi:hypothetical protein
MNLHLTISRTATGEVRVEYIGPDRIAAQNAYETNIEGAVVVEYFPFMEAQRIRKISLQPAPIAAQNENSSPKKK